jgi:DNA-binding NarL/FixJ family response regulator
MRFPQLLVFESDGRLAACLRGPAAERGWSLREPRRLDSALRLLERGGPNLLLIRAGRDLEREFALLDRATERFPDSAVVLIADGDHPRLIGLAWDLGATYVLTADQARERLVELAESLLRGEA